MSRWILRATVYATLGLLLGPGLGFAQPGPPPPPFDPTHTKVPSSLRYGSGLIDVPVATVLPPGRWTLTYSGFFIGAEAAPESLPGATTGFADPDGGWHGDFNAAVGVGKGLEVGVGIQSLAGEEEGGPLGAVFGRWTPYNAQWKGVGLAFGGMLLNSPDYPGEGSHAPTRLGIADPRATADQPAHFDTNVNLYAVAGTDVAGRGPDWLPRHSWTMSGGWGLGLFREGDGETWYESTDTEGAFGGIALHVEGNEASTWIATAMVDYNGFDWNAGLQIDRMGMRVGGYLLGFNHTRDLSEFRTVKAGLLVSVCRWNGGREPCQPQVRRENAPVQVGSLPHTERL